jgi:glycerate 2-kinase
MKILIAPDKFKGSLSAIEVCDIIQKSIYSIKPDSEVISLPLADGGEGFSEAIIGNKAFEKYELTVNDPVHRWIKASFFKNKSQTAIIEMANASGLKLLNEKEYNPLKTSTLGTGELIMRAFEIGAKEIIIGIGGSATNDGGMGVAVGLGYQFLDKNGQVLKPSGEQMINVASIISPQNKPWQKCKIKVACDVGNPLYGTNGAAHVFAKQKGANEEAIKLLDAGLRHFSMVVNNHFGAQFDKKAGAGAAGGLGFGLMAFLGAELNSGIDLILEANNFDQILADCDLVITGEGKIDNQTLNGKVVFGVTKKANAKNIPVYAICGVSELSISQIVSLGLQKLTTLKSADISVDFAIKNAEKLLFDRTLELF